MKSNVQNDVTTHEPMKFFHYVITLDCILLGRFRRTIRHNPNNELRQGLVDLLKYYSKRGRSE